MAMSQSQASVLPTPPSYTSVMSVASAHFDENAVDLGYRTVVVVGPGQKVLAEPAAAGSDLAAAGSDG